ncbi:replication restart helicase PriA [Candidatus Neoehrlichia procyonis]|uniref:Replication restart protein PriA n=1 Tax=Candidatus Neoehrlichia procyonis str. RAC413 TaxID=1359163 RepID=A0A0F3NLP7_9RICK|nr:primosomal protein N' [Candidatus Neoehrlichia lotoris]KJV68993.1 primosomal protein N' [Candidatus Neoehrlichia lotoris str. RAC413]
MIAEVLLPLPLDKSFYYIVPDNVVCSIGDYITVCFNNRMLIGVIIGFKSHTVSNMNLKYINSKLCIPSINLLLINFIQWVGFYNVIPMGLILKMVFGGVVSVKSLDKLVYNAEHLSTVDDISINLSSEQNDAYNKIIKNIFQYSVMVLDGETGSGKTEVYCSVIKTLLQRDQSVQVLILLPEIVLTAQLMKRINYYFSTCNSVEWHSNLTTVQRRNNWLKIVYGDASIIVGARSALFLPYKNLKMIIVDEEHEYSFKQDYGAIYNARNMSIILAKQANIPVILSSATPSLETIYNIYRKQYYHIVLSKRFGDAHLPDVKIVDMRQSVLINKWLSTDLYNNIVKALNEGNQVMLFLNRRGYARLVLCKKCGFKVNCPNCCTWLIDHKEKRMLLCHYCNYHCSFPKICSNCFNESSMISYGVGIEKVAEDIQKLILNAKVALISSDMTIKCINNVIERILKQEINIVIGTQIVAKGHNFPKLTLVGVIDADLGLGNSDLRAAEKTYQLLHQVAGRSGRFQEKGNVILQTYDAENPLIQSLLLYNRKLFYELEMRSRYITNMPPYVRLIALIITGRKELEVMEVAKNIVNNLVKYFVKSKYIEILGPVPAPIGLVNNNYRYRILIKISDNMLIQKLLSKYREYYKNFKSVTLIIDIDPINFM